MKPIKNLKSYVNPTKLIMTDVHNRSRMSLGFKSPTAISNHKRKN